MSDLTYSQQYLFWCLTNLALELESKVLDEKEDLFEDQVVSWAASDDAIATVNDFGEVAGIAPGVTTIIGTQINVYQKVTVTVEAAAAE